MDAEEANIYNAILITSIVIGTIIIFFIVSITKQQRRNLALHRSKILAEITMLEKERARIAHDLHDELGPLLSAVKMKINSFELSDEEDILQIEKTNKHINDILKRIREISFDLMPTSLLRKGLISAIKEFVDYLNNSNSIRFVLNADQNLKFNDQRSINLYRIVQEVVHNAIKHSGATELKIDVQPVKNNVILTMSDNGYGFDFAKESSTSPGFGLKGLVSRIEVIGGQMYLESKPGQGTKYTFEIPT